MVWSVVVLIATLFGAPLWLFYTVGPLLVLSGILVALESFARGLPVASPSPGWFRSSRFKQRLLGTIIGIPFAALIIYLKSR
jgi:hypothetical protein